MNNISPKFNSVRADIVQNIEFNNEKLLIKFVQGIQAGSPVDSKVTPIPWDMPGYTDQVIMAAGAFTHDGERAAHRAVDDDRAKGLNPGRVRASGNSPGAAL